MDLLRRISRKFQGRMMHTRRLMSSEGTQEKVRPPNQSGSCEFIAFTKEQGSHQTQDIITTIVCPSNHGQIIEQLREHFLHDEPLNKMFGFRTPGQPIPDNENYLLTSMAQGLSIMALHLPTSKIAGVAISSLMSSQSYNKPKMDPRCAKMSQLLGEIVDSLNLDEIYSLDHILSLRALSIASQFRRLGLSTRLILESEKLARASGVKLIETEATNKFSQKAFESCGYTTIWSKEYEDMLDKNCEKMFTKIYQPHCDLKIMIKCLE